MENTKLSFLVLPSAPAIKLGFETWIDNQKVVDIDHVQQPTEISVPITDNEAEHTLKLVLKNKCHEHTTVNDAGDIVADAVLEIQNLSFDNITLGDLVTEKTVYTHNFNGTGNTTTDKFYGVMGCNGTVELQFTTPVYLWFLENM